MSQIQDVSALFPSQPPQPLPATALAPLDGERILAVRGPDATRFLQGQLTCDVAALATGSSTLGARCNPKGRMQSSFRLLKISDESYLLAMAGELLEPQQQDLARYAAFFKVTLEEASSQWLRLGLWGDQAPAALAAATPGDVYVLPISDHTHELWLPAAHAESALTSLTREATPVPASLWELQMIRLGIGQVRAETRESFIPQMLNLQHLGGVSFHKGCYTGQEIVARMQYLGKLKRRMYRLRWEGTQLPAPGTAIHDSSTGQAVGEVVMAAQADAHIELLAVLQNEAAALPGLAIDNIIEPSLQLATLPYEQQMAAEPDAQ